MKGVISIRDFTNLKDFMDRLTSWIIPGNSIAVYYKNERVFSYSSGFADLENRRQMQGMRFYGWMRRQGNAAFPVCIISISNSEVFLQTFPALIMQFIR